MRKLPKMSRKVAELVFEFFTTHPSHGAGQNNWLKIDRMRRKWDMNDFVGENEKKTSQEDKLTGITLYRKMTKQEENLTRRQEEGLT